MPDLWTPSSPERQLRDHLERAIAERGLPLHPDLRPILDGESDPTAREHVNGHGETISAELRSLESALAYYTTEGLFYVMTPLGMAATAYAMLQTLSGDHGAALDDLAAQHPGQDVDELLDPWGELRPAQATEIPELEHGEVVTVREECRRALWHLERAYLALKPGRE